MRRLFKYKNHISLFAGIFIILVIFLLILQLYPVKVSNFTIQTTTNLSPTKTFIESVKEINTLQVTEKNNQAINPVCNTKLLTHNKKTEKVIVLYHGYTNCPEQMKQLGELLFEKGYNVYIPLLPHHGLMNRETDSLKSLTSKDLVNFTNKTIDVSYGLGNRVDVLGISGGAVLATFVAEEKSDIHSVVLVAPTFLPPNIPVQLSNLTVNLLQVLPNQFYWWNNNEKEKIAGPQYAYPRYSTHGINAFYSLANLEIASSKINRVKAENIFIVTNENDTAVNTFSISEIQENWKNLQGNVIEYQFPKGLNLPHDVIDPNQLQQKTAIVYPKLNELLFAK